jgi:ubiquinone/menaquinone biosynthesis C-methylase UbiE
MLNPFARRGNPHALVVGMTGVKMGDSIVQVGCAHGGRAAAIAAKVGLSGRAAMIVADDASEARARKGAEDAGVLIDIQRASPPQLPLGANEFDLGIVDDTGGLFGSLSALDAAGMTRELWRVIRPAGRVMLLGSAPPKGLGALVARGESHPPFVSSESASQTLQAGGFRSVRTLAEREGLVFVEALKPR